MKLIKPSFEIWEQPSGLEGVYKQIERVGRVCYKSEDKITEDSAKPFVDRMIKSGHGAMLEHGTVYLKVFNVIENSELIDKYKSNKYSVVKEGTEVYNCHGDILYGSCKCITTNYRVLVENGWLDDLKYICKPTEFHEKRITVHFVCDRGVSHEFVRHRVMSFAQESTRYCNYSKDKFGNELTFIIPCWIKDLEEKSYLAHAEYHHTKEDASKQWYDVCMNSEFVYEDLIRLGWKPQEARAVLPNSLKTELVVTGFVSDWNHFFDLRARGTTGAPHPQAKELAEPLMKEFIARKYINN
uniref:FAD-dependent thymidylate synthase n=1 Tax=Lachnospira eligens TaxID=39485 RepID=UPI00402814D5